MENTLHTDAIEEFRYDPQTQRYRWRGAGGGQFASKSAVLNRTRDYIDEQRSQLSQHATGLTNGDIDLGQWQRRSAETLKKIHVSQAILGHDGVENMTSEDWLRVAREVKRQTLGGVGEDGRRYGIKELAKELKNGTISEKKLLARIQMYGHSGKTSQSEAFKALDPLPRLKARGIRDSGKECR